MALATTPRTNTTIITMAKGTTISIATTAASISPSLLVLQPPRSIFSKRCVSTYLQSARLLMTAIMHGNDLENSGVQMTAQVQRSACGERMKASWMILRKCRVMVQSRHHTDQRMSTPVQSMKKKRSERGRSRN